MRFKAWLDMTGRPYTDVAKELEVTEETVRRYAKGTRIPDRTSMPRVVRLTKGAVMPNDFYDLEAVAVV